MTTLDDIDRMRDDREIDGLIRALYDEDEFVRAQAALSLGALADPRAKDHLDLMQNEDRALSQGCGRDRLPLAGRPLEEVEAARALESAELEPENSRADPDRDEEHEHPDLHKVHERDIKPVPAAIPTTTTFAEAPMMVPFPPRHAPSESAHQSG